MQVVRLEAVEHLDKQTRLVAGQTRGSCQGAGMVGKSPRKMNEGVCHAPTICRQLPCPRTDCKCGGMDACHFMLQPGTTAEAGASATSSKEWVRQGADMTTMGKPDAREREPS
jgi:hypothetical protein